MHDAPELSALPAHLTPEERYCLGRKFSRSSALCHVEIYFLPSCRNIVARSVYCVRRFRLPSDAVLVGIYATPFRTELFLSDLDDVAAAICRARIAQDASAPDPATRIAA